MKALFQLLLQALFLMLLFSTSCCFPGTEMDSLIDFTMLKGFKSWCPLEEIYRKSPSSLELFICDARKELGIPDEEVFP